MTERQSRRVFFALWPDGPALDRLEEAARAGEALCGGRRMRRDSLHITLAFVGDVSPGQLALLQDVGGKLAVAPFEIVLDQLGCWPHNRIFWAGCRATPSCLRRLSGSLSRMLDAAGFRVESQAYVPHVTLLRNAHCGNPPELGAPVRWQAGEFTLVESALQPDGARYRVLERWPLHTSR